jgi:hypothetical protein
MNRRHATSGTVLRPSSFLLQFATHTQSCRAIRSRDREGAVRSSKHRSHPATALVAAIRALALPANAAALKPATARLEAAR